MHTLLLFQLEHPERLLPFLKTVPTFHLLRAYVCVCVLCISQHILYCAVRFLGCTFNSFKVTVGVVSNTF